MDARNEAIAGLESDLAAARSAAETQSILLEDAETRLSERDAAIASLEGDLRDAQVAAESLSLLLGAAEAQLDARNEAIARLEFDLRAAQTQLEAAAANRLKMKDAEVAGLEAELEALAAKLQASDARNAALKAELQGALAAAESVAAQLDDAANQLQEKDAAIKSIESDLRDKEAVIDSQGAQLKETRQKLEEEPAIIRVHEPMGFYIDPYDTATEQRMLTAIACVGDMPAGYSPHVYYRISNQAAIHALAKSGEYKIVGQDKYSSADWTSEERDIEVFYTRDEVLESHAYHWIEDEDWVTNEMAWFASLHDYCGDTVNR